LTLPSDNSRLAEKVQLCSVRVKSDTNQQSYFMVDIRHCAAFIRDELGLGRKIRVVGRLINAKRKSVVLQAEHIEIKPAHSKLKQAFD